MLTSIQAVLYIMDTSPTPHNLCTQPWAKPEESCRAERNLAMTFVPLPHFRAPVISGLCKHSSGQPKGSMTQQDQSSSKIGTVCSIAQVFARLQSYCSSMVLFQPHRVLQYQSHGLCIKVFYQNKKRNNNNLKTDWHENCSTFYISSHNRVGYYRETKTSTYIPILFKWKIQDKFILSEHFNAFI